MEAADQPRHTVWAGTDGKILPKFRYSPLCSASWHIIYLEKHFKGSRTAERIIWRIGNGENVKIWEDPWLPKGLQENQSHLRDHVC